MREMGCCRKRDGSVTGARVVERVIVSWFTNGFARPQWVGGCRRAASPHQSRGSVVGLAVGPP